MSERSVISEIRKAIAGELIRWAFDLWPTPRHPKIVIAFKMMMDAIMEDFEQ